MPTYMTLDDVRNEDHIDSRDLIDLRDAMEDMLGAGDDALDPDERTEMTAGVAAINELAESGIEDWPHGAQLIAEHAFEDYAREFAEDIGAVPRGDGEWPRSFIDWPAAADALKTDYMAVDFLGTTYYVR